MKKWIKFKFKNLIWLYGIFLFAVFGLLIFLMIRDGEPHFAIGIGAIGLVVLTGVWFAYHYGIRISEKGYLIICNQRIKFFKREQVSNICFYFSDKGNGTYDVVAKVITIDQHPFEFVWIDFYAKGFRKLKFNVKQNEIEDIITELSSDEKIKAKII